MKKKQEYKLSESSWEHLCFILDYVRLNSTSISISISKNIVTKLRKDAVQKRFKDYKKSNGERLESIHTLRVTYTRLIGLEQKVTGEKAVKYFDGLVGEWLSTGDYKKLQNQVLSTLSREDSSLKKTIINYFKENSKVHSSVELGEKLATVNDELVCVEFNLNSNDKKYIEGKIKCLLHWKKERNLQLVKNAKRFWSQENNGHLKCEVCSFLFTEKYGELGIGFIEAHHKLPISSLTEETEFSGSIPILQDSF